MVVPYKEEKSGKKEQVAKMFDNISHRYDFLNHFLSLGIDKGWRKKAIQYLKPFQPKQLLDVATGTGDFAIQALALNPEKIIGIDISAGMLEVGKRKIVDRHVSDRIELMLGDSENLPFEDGRFDAVTVAFGVRNFENLERGLREINRVLKPNGQLVVLEFSKPQKFPFRQVYNFYFKFVLPKIGRAISSDKAAYTYLPESVEAFPDGEKFLHILNIVGFKHAKCRTLTFGISSIYTGTK
ncbi:bifunctional demethylmenaquinone methyltransferase/2-methoxy-6-polyprenyl-1,4-benzoquinol methylase UbiE [Ohtaekwangia koreensis]|jgi:demethylmenaquinone methyltransferase/2-methoxy-6-polyprenyl-1,4-benzoquinol methylase|uniref:Demethylmenaquinone methyltransferase n=1 Tax=Ohtaekwangia koreensis TaxID=688867 RepID=A0A1T5J0T3_9BACT|nr:bifunctional demethylmenaquinone methyltransferase/2-methoxy-6-polyprenyl-1,4-benzoquinol methylase UbiE [Ohtaekwangia koreensis]SKC44944.1 demethylmenaquinone methyltransferase / 2-methoxy-6-polyprenyl-1,4-benzoquinol methylase [Ohtaekwangia koreensis]